PFPTPHSYLRPATTSDLIAAMRTAKLIITTLLALQLFVTAGLCGSACCATAPDRVDHGGSAAEDSYEPATEEKIEGGHCPMHAGKEAKPKPRERKQYSLKTTQRPVAARRQDYQTRSSSAIDAHFCACSVKRDKRLFDALLQRSFEQRPAPQVLLGALNLSGWLIESSPPQITSPDSSRSHSPPFNGRRFQLRI
ncbi:MAG: hypothetical protein ACREAB_03920, partial [Blastocatellia bacterium]